METNVLGTSDLLHHLVKFGIDVYEPIDIDSERTRLNVFYEEARNRWSDMFEKLLASPTEFKISKEFAQRSGKPPSIPIDTFVLTQRGPVLVVPVRLPPPIGATGLEDKIVDLFDGVRELFFAALGVKRQCLRVGMVRELVFDTGETQCQHLIATQSSFAGADLVGGKRLLVFRDAKCNLRIELEPLEIAKTVQLPVGTNVQQHAGYGVRVLLDVNNAVFKPLGTADMKEILERASSLWPDELLKFVNERSSA
jgi:hypothetical protein